MDILGKMKKCETRKHLHINEKEDNAGVNALWLHVVVIFKFMLSIWICLCYHWSVSKPFSEIDKETNGEINIRAVLILCSRALGSFNTIKFIITDFQFLQPTKKYLIPNRIKISAIC